MKRLSALVLSLLLVLASVLPAAAEEALIPVTMPASYVPEGFTQEVLDSVAGGTFVRGTLNADGSVTMEMTEAQRDTAKASASAAIDAAIAELVADE
ncbi:MAG: hypothetical protein Q4C53_09705, partial [Clostridia bacterium]|nr:hypothetical protein [Clostridia bacterium]